MNTPLPQKELGYEGKIVRFVEFQKKHFNFRYSLFSKLRILKKLNVKKGSVTSCLITFRHITTRQSSISPYNNNIGSTARI